MRPKPQVRIAALAGLLAGAGLTAAGSSPTYALLSAAGLPEQAAEQAVEQVAKERPAPPAAATVTETAVEPAAEVTPPPCPVDVRNHGEYVSSVARAAQADREPGKPEDPGAHGALVSAAARTDCGKDAAEETTAGAADATEDRAEAAKPGKGSQTRPDHAGRPASPGRSGERSRAAR